MRSCASGIRPVFLGSLHAQAAKASAAFLDEFKLCRGDVAVSLHHPQAFLIKFQHRRHCEEAIAKGYVKRRGIEIHFIEWRSLQSALGVALMFRVRLCLDGVPMHAWAADIAERLIGHTCALEQIETDLVHPMESGNTCSMPMRGVGEPDTIRRMWLASPTRRTACPRSWRKIGRRGGVVIRCFSIWRKSMTTRRRSST